MSFHQGEKMAESGYAGEILKVDLTHGNLTRIPTADYSDKFIGGRGFAVKLYWDAVPADASALGPDNALVFSTGPAAGFSGLAGCRWQVCGKSTQSEPEAFTYCNLGGKWGLDLKYAGYDALLVQGKAGSPVYLSINNNNVEIKDAAGLWGQSSFDSIDGIKEEIGQDVSALTIGPAGENKVVFATIFAEGGASGSSGLGAIMGSKNLKAIAAAGSRRPQAADPERLQRIVHHIKEIRGGGNRPSPWGVPGITWEEECYGCDVWCSRQAYRGDKGHTYKAFCQATDVYKKAVMEYYGKWNEAQLLAIRLCDAWGLDTDVMQGLIDWLIACYKEGILTEEAAGLPLSLAGSAEFIEGLTRKISLREGFGDVLAQGTLRAARLLGRGAEEIAGEFVATRSSENKDYDPRLFITTAIFYATEPRRPIHQLHGVSGSVMAWLPFARGEKNAAFTTDMFRANAVRNWGSEKAADFSTYEGKALAAKKIQDRAYAKECLILCDLAGAGSPMSTHSEESPLESQVLAAITGREIDESGLYQIGERVFNFQRAVQLRHGWGGRKGDKLLDHLYTQPLKQGSVFFNPEALMPGPEGKVISRLGAVVDRSSFDNMMSQYYALRGWNPDNGLPKAATLKKLGLENVAFELEKRGLLGF
jgi:aldehyde:ferredoxin oxidoreductase